MENREGIGHAISIGQPERPSFDRPLQTKSVSTLAREALKFVLLLPCIALSLPSLAGDLTVPSPSRTRISEMPFTLYRGYLVIVDGRLGSLEHQNLLIDTGTSPSMIDETVSAKLGLQGITKEIALFNTKVNGQTVNLSDIEMGPLHPRNVQVMVADFSKVMNGVGTRIDAVIGLDVLGGSSFTLDYQKHRIYFHATPERHVVPFTAGPQFITVDLKAGGRDLHLLLDTGTPHLVLFEKALRNLDYDPTRVMGRGQNISGSVAYNTVILESTKLGREEMGPQRVSVVAGEETSRAGYDGLVGISLLRPKRLSFDFERQLIAWSN